MRPLSDVAKALLSTANRLSAAGRAVTLAEMAAGACAGQKAARTTVSNLKRHGHLKIVGMRRVQYRNRPVTDLTAFMPPMWLQALHWIAGVVVLAEALNKLQRTAPCAGGLSYQARVTVWLKVVAWTLLAVGGAGAMVTPLMRLQPPSLQDACVMLGFAVLIIRTRVKEG